MALNTVAAPGELDSPRGRRGFRRGHGSPAVGVVARRLPGNAPARHGLRVALETSARLVLSQYANAGNLPLGFDDSTACFEGADVPVKTYFQYASWTHKA